ncbi:MAG: glucosaminidase domain-containing protein [Bacteroidia bacterium]|nr:glucosaminidase domain-containing protein [Bacteroidia bacterium]
MGRTKLFFPLLFIWILNSPASARLNPKQYIHKFAPLAIHRMHIYQIPASVILGVAFLESGYGNSKNAILLHNHFGLVGQNNLRKTGRYRSVYKQFKNDTFSFDYFSRTLVSKKYYPKLKGKLYYKVWLANIHNHHYAKSKLLWVRRIASIIRKYHLYRFDIDLRKKNRING